LRPAAKEAGTDGHAFKIPAMRRQVGDHLTKAGLPE